ncbi:MAG: cytochrome c, partial [Draconibacterium sp.]|nr:cytochrome c [Draconibacterium sp.]
MFTYNHSVRFLLSVTLLVVISFVSGAQDAPALYQQHCAQCHGTNLTGGNASSLVDEIWQFGAEDGYFFRNVKFGIAHLG